MVFSERIQNIEPFAFFNYFVLDQKLLTIKDQIPQIGLWSAHKSNTVKL